MKLQGDKKTIIKIGGGILIAAAIAFFLKSAAQPGDLKGMILHEKQKKQHDPDTQG